MSIRPAIWAFIAAVFILLCCSFTIPVVGAEVQKFQSLITAVVASVAALTAYEGAMSKVAFDRTVEARKLDRERFNLMVKLQYSLGRHVIEIRRAIASLEEFKASGTGPFFRAATPQCPPALQAAWDRLDLIPANAITPLSLVILATELPDFGEAVEENGSDSIRTQKLIAGQHLHVLNETRDQVEQLLSIAAQEVARLQKRIRFD